MTIKNVMKKPTVTITKLGAKPSYMDNNIYEHIKGKLNTPLPVSCIHYYSDGRLCSVSIFLPELEYVFEDNGISTVTCETAMFFDDSNHEMTLSYVD